MVLLLLLLLLLVSGETSPAVFLGPTDDSPGLSPVFPGSPETERKAAATDPALWEDLSLSLVPLCPALRTFRSQILADDAGGDGDAANPRLAELVALCYVCDSQAVSNGIV